MKITIISPVFPYPNRGILGGIERVVENLSIFLKKLNHNVKIVTTYWNGGNRYDKYKEIPILRVKDSKSIFGKLGSIFLFNSFSFGLNILRKKNFTFYRDSDIIILSFVFGFTRFFKFKRIPVISIFYHYENPRSIGDYLNLPFYNYLAKKQFSKHKNIITASESSKKQVIDFYDVKSEYIKFIPYGINLERFNPKNHNPEIKNKFGNSILLYVGAFYERKRIPILLKAMTNIIKQIPEAHLILIGTGQMLDYCKKFSKLLGIDQNVTFLGFVKDDLIRKYYASSEIFILPSELEGYGLVILEAMASGTPVICANKPPMSKIIENGGRTFKLNNSNDLSKKIIMLLNDREELSKLKRNALLIVKKYEWNHIIKIYIDYLNEKINLNINRYD